MSIDYVKIFILFFEGWSSTVGINPYGERSAVLIPGKCQGKLSCSLSAGKVHMEDVSARIGRPRPNENSELSDNSE